MPEIDLTSEALSILGSLASMPFDDCFPLLREFDALPARAGLYAVRHRESGILYLGKSLHVRNRFRGGHKALYCCYVDGFPSEDIRIAVFKVSEAQSRRLLDLEARMIQIAKPRYNSRIRKSED
jgi:excinuclease UvrABC nuclease subunit